MDNSTNGGTAFFGIVMVLMATIALWAFASPGQVYAIAWSVVPLVLLVAFRRQFNRFFISLISIPAVLFVAIGLAGLFFEEAMQSVPGGETLKLVMDETLRERTAILFATASLGIVAGGLLTSIGRKRQPLAHVHVSLPLAARRWMLPLSLIPLALLTGGDIGAVLERTEYLSQDAGGLGGFAAQLSLGAVILLGHLFAIEKGVSRVTILMAFAAYCVLFFSLASRSFAMALPLFAIGYFSGTFNAKGKVLIAAGCAWALYALQIPLFMRSQPVHGLFPYVQALPDFISRPSEVLQPIKNILIAFNITAETAFGSPSIPLENIMIALNPMSGDAAGWYNIASQQRLNLFVPYSGIGELANVGGFELFAFFLCAGFVLGYMERRVARLLREDRQIYGLIFVGLAALFAFMCIQYNLRSASRILYYMIVFDVGLAFFLSWKRTPPPVIEPHHAPAGSVPKG